MSDVPKTLILRKEVLGYVPELPDDREEAIAFVKEEIAKVEKGRTSVVTALPKEDALWSLRELLWFVENYIFMERSSSNS